MAVASVSFLMNLFNMIPVPPLDGGPDLRRGLALVLDYRACCCWACGRLFSLH